MPNATGESSASIELPDGARAALCDGALELRGRDGMLLFRYRDGNAEVYAPEGDLTLAAPKGQVVLAAEQRIALRVGRDRPQIEVAEDAVDVTVERGRVNVGSATVVARAIETSAKSIVQHAERYELSAVRLVERTRDTIRDVSGLLQTRAGRARTFVSDLYALYSGRTVMVSKEETSVDGKRILLG